MGAITQKCLQREFIFSLLMSTCDMTFQMWKEGSAFLHSMNQRY